MACNKALSTVACSFEFTNVADEDLYLLKRNTPLEGLRSNFLTVSAEGRPVPYKGPVLYRIPPKKDEFVLLKTGESISASVQITDVFSIDTDGLYTVQYSNPLRYLSVHEMMYNRHEVRESDIDETVYIYLENTRFLLKPIKPEEPKISFTVHFQSCSSASFTNGSTNQSATLDAHKLLCSGIDNAKGKVGNNDLYKTWFGAHTSSRESTVKTVYQSVRNGISGRSLTYHNSGPHCDDTTVAYTYMSWSYTTVHLCKIYFPLPTSCRGTDYTKERTLLHEWAHALGYRDDYKKTYGGDECKKLAKNDPDGAIKNADNFSFHYCGAK